MEVGPLPVSCPTGEMEAQSGKDCAYVSQSVAWWWGPRDRWLKVGASANAKIKWWYVYIRRRKWQPTPVLLPGKFHGWKSLVGYSPWGRKESDMTERLHFLSFCSSFWRRKWQPTPVFLPGKSHGQWGLVDCSL